MHSFFCPLYHILFSCNLQYSRRHLPVKNTRPKWQRKNARMPDRIRYAGVYCAVTVLAAPGGRGGGGGFLGAPQPPPPPPPRGPPPPPPPPRGRSASSLPPSKPGPPPLGTLRVPRGLFQAEQAALLLVYSGQLPDIRLDVLGIGDPFHPALPAKDALAHGPGPVGQNGGGLLHHIHIV